MKLLKVGDLHLGTKEIRSTKKLVDNNVVMLENLYNFIVENEDIGLVEFLGDIQHATPEGRNTLKEVSRWRYWFSKIGEEMQRRYDKDTVEIYMKTDKESKEVMKSIEDGDIYPIFSLKGNHDIDNTEDYTFFDDLIESGLLVNPKVLVIDGTTQINYHNYGEADVKIEKKEGVEKVISMYHDVIATEESPFWVGPHPAYPAEEILDGVDLGIIAHIHDKSDPIIVETTSGEQSVSWTIGSMGRTAFTTGQVRDVGYCALVDTGNLTQLGTVEIDVIPKEEYFNYRGELQRREEKKSYNDFKLGLDETVMRQYHDPREDIRELESVSEDVKAVCLEIMDEVMEG